MLTPILHTRLKVPPLRPDVLRRQRLMTRLDQGLKGKLILISSPAGSGKTTLAASFLHELITGQLVNKIGWLALNEEDNDVTRVLSDLIAAIEPLHPKIRQTIRPLLSLPQSPDIKLVVTLILNTLNSLPDPMVLALDDFHLIKNPEAQKLFTYFIENLPSQFHLVLVTREDPIILPLHKYRAHGQLLEIRMNEIRFTREEASDFLNQTMGLDLNLEATTRLAEQTEGWIAGLQMVALTLRGQATETAIASAPAEAAFSPMGRNYLIEYFGAEVLRQQRVEIRSFLQQAAILERFNASLCEAVTERANSQSLLQELEQANLFLIPLDHEQKWYRFHHLFADLLQAELSASLREELHRRASRWYAAEGMVTEAIRHSLAGQDAAEAVRLIRENAEEVLRNADYATISTWVNMLPEAVIRTHCDMQVRKGWFHCLQGDFAAAETYEKMAVENMREEDSLKDRSMFLSFRSRLALDQGRAADAIVFAQQALDLLEEKKTFHKTTALSNLGQAQRLLGDLEAAITTLREAVATGQELGIPSVTIESLSFLTTMLSQIGKLSEAIRICEANLRDLVDTDGNPHPVALSTFVVLGILYYEANQLDLARHHLSLGIARSKALGFAHRTLRAQYTLAKVYEAQGERELLAEALQNFYPSPKSGESNPSSRLYIVLLTELQLRRGQADAAATTLAALPASPQERTWEENLLVSRHLLAQGKFDEAAEFLVALEQSAAKQQRVRRLISVHLAKALLYHLQSRKSEAVECLQEAIRLAAPEGYVQSFLEEAIELAPLLKKCEQLAPSFVSKLLQAIDSMRSSFPLPKTDTLPSGPDSLKSPLTKTQLKVLQLVVKGLSNRDIAATLQITEGTTKWHLNQIYSKLEVKSRSQAIAKAHELGLA